ncbi:MAG: PadR family transcriptional regulator [Desulfobacca sp.]|nr:PadR family transcriptional regulator [Desulfobacca sp.]
MSNHIYQTCLQGMLKIIILHQAAKGPFYGLAFSKFMQGLGYNISPGSLYPLLHGMEKEGLLSSYTYMIQGRIRKYYELSDQGRACLVKVQNQLAGLVQEIILNN